jgi:Ca2+-binding RTX toxin-like protein
VLHLCCYYSGDGSPRRSGNDGHIGAGSNARIHGGLRRHGPCIGTSGNDTINASDKQDVIYGLEGDDVIDPGIDSATDYVYCGPGFDTVNQMPGVVDDIQDAIQYEASEPDVIVDDCEEMAL